MLRWGGCASVQREQGCGTRAHGESHVPEAGTVATDASAHVRAQAHAPVLVHTHASIRM